MRNVKIGMVLAGACAGLVAGLFGAGGGLVLVPLLTLLTDVADDTVFSSSISIILPICLTCIAVTAMSGGIAFRCPALSAGQRHRRSVCRAMGAENPRVLAPPGTGTSDSVGRVSVFMLTSFPVCVFVGSLLGFLTGMGVGGGSLLILWLTLVLGFDQAAARGINLLFFLPASAICCVFRLRQGKLNLRVCLPAILSGCAAAVLGSLIAASLDTGLLRRPFGILLLLTGLRELLYRPKKR